MFARLIARVTALVELALNIGGCLVYRHGHAGQAAVRAGHPVTGPASIFRFGLWRKTGAGEGIESPLRLQHSALCKRYSQFCNITGSVTTHLLPTV